MEEKKEIKVTKEEAIMAEETVVAIPAKDTDKGINESMLFVTENNRFDISVKFNDDNGDIIVERVDDKFTITDKTQELIVTIKYPSQGDYDLIGQSFGKGLMGKEFDVKDFIALEIVRLFTLIRKWSMKKTLNQESLLQLKPKIVKSILAGVRDKIGMDGIL